MFKARRHKDNILEKAKTHGGNFIDKAKEHTGRVVDVAKEKTEQIKVAMPKSDAEIGAHIEKKLSRGQKLWSNVGAVVFSKEALINITHFSSIFLTIVSMLFVGVILAFPTDKASLEFGNLVQNFAFILAGIFVINAISYASIFALGSRVSIKTFLSTVNTTLLMSFVVFSLPAALIIFALFSTMQSSQATIDMFFRIIPFYNYLVFGWSVETVSELKGVRAIASALIALTAILIFNLTLAKTLI